MPTLIGVFETLAAQHAEARAMFDRIRAEPEQRAVLWPVLRAALVAHERAEVRELYPVLRAREPALADHHDDEAFLLDTLIEKLGTYSVLSTAWEGLFEQLAATVVAHATEEETRIFPAAQAALGEAISRALDAPVAAARAMVAEQL